MKTFANANARSVQDAARRARDARQTGQHASFAGGGTDLLQLVKERIVSPDLIVNLKTIPNLSQVTRSSKGVSIGGLATLDAISRDETIRRDYPVLAEAAASVATPQIRNVGTIGGNIAQRPWCWYYRNGFPCYKNGGNQCFSFAGENQFHAIFGGGPSYIVHPSDTAPALVALGATIRIAGPSGERAVPASEFFVLPRQNAAVENVLADDEVIASVDLPSPVAGTRSRYFKVTDRETWTHAVVSAAVVMQMEGETCRAAHVVLGGVAPIPWRLPNVEQMLAGQPITEDLAARAAEAAVAGARPLSHNAYKIPMTKGVVRRTVLQVAGKT
ncbi:MAG: xanthine dehydrogenase family protein subunit M [Vicinamibacterales bacterium]